MRKEEIDILLQRFYAGESTAEEEKMLSDFFNGTDVPEDFVAEKALFNFYNDDSQIPEPSASLDEKIISSIEPDSKRVIRLFIFRVSGIAAGILFLIGTWYYFTNKGPEDTFKDPEIAYAETMRVLFNVSSKLNEGLATLEPVSGMDIADAGGFRALAKSRETLRENLDNLDHLDRIITDINKMNVYK